MWHNIHLQNDTTFYVGQILNLFSEFYYFFCSQKLIAAMLRENKDAMWHLPRWRHTLLPVLSNILHCGWYLLDILRLVFALDTVWLQTYFADSVPCCVCVQWVCKGGVQPRDAAFKDSGRHSDASKGLLHAAQLGRPWLFHHVGDHAEWVHPGAHLRGGEVGARWKHLDDFRKIVVYC